MYNEEHFTQTVVEVLPPSLSVMGYMTETQRPEEERKERMVEAPKEEPKWPVWGCGHL